jgi:hypothetical protein
VRKLAANSSVCAVSDCAAPSLQRLTNVVKLAITENKFYEHPESSKSSAIKLQKFAVIFIYFARARS